MEALRVSNPARHPHTQGCTGTPPGVPASGSQEPPLFLYCDFQRQKDPRIIALQCHLTHITFIIHSCVEKGIEKETIWFDFCLFSMNIKYSFP